MRWARYIIMDLEYTWILWQGRIVVNLGCCQFFHPIGRQWMGLIGGGGIISASYKFKYRIMIKQPKTLERFLLMLRQIQ